MAEVAAEELGAEADGPDPEQEAKAAAEEAAVDLEATAEEEAAADLEVESEEAAAVGLEREGGGGRGSGSLGRRRPDLVKGRGRREGSRQNWPTAADLE